jgi:hypothetical protein
MFDNSLGNNPNEPWRNGAVPPHAFDPLTQPELFRGVLTRRVFAFLIDLVVLSVPVILVYLFIAVFGLITLGLGWALFWLAWPASVIWAVVYYRGHADDGSGAAHLVRRAGLLCARRHPCRAVLGIGVVFDAADSAGRAVQRPPAPAARHHPGNRGYQQFGAQPGGTTGANVLSEQTVCSVEQTD